MSASRRLQQAKRSRLERAGEFPLAASRDGLRPSLDRRAVGKRRTEAGTLAEGRRRADTTVVLYPSLILAGLVIGLVFGRWWTLGAAAAVGTWIALATEVDEVPGWYLGAGYALMVAVGIRSVGLSSSAGAEPERLRKGGASCERPVAPLRWFRPTG
jgi:hypothetical protein